VIQQASGKTFQSTIDIRPNLTFADGIVRFGRYPMNIINLVWHFAVHVFVGTLLFIIIGIGPVFLHLFVTWVEGQQTFFLVTYVLKTLEQFVFGLDVVCYVWFLIRIVWRFMIEIKEATER
jgi:hypothetical protein